MSHPPPPPTVEAVQAALDAALEAELARLAARGVVPSCRAGCATCCHHAIQVARPEVEPLVRFVRERFTDEERARVHQRVRAWLDWLDQALRDPALRRPGALEEHISRHAPVCPFLVEHRCTVYPVRPLVCRAHYVTSPKERCLPVERGGPGGEPARIVHALAEEGERAAAALRALAPGDRDVLFLAEAYAELAGLERQ